MLLAQNMILMGIFFTIPLYLQIVQGLDALETGVRMLPTSVGLFVTALIGSALAGRFAPRTLVRAGLLITLLATLLLLDTINPELDDSSFLVAMGVLGVGMGLVISQLGNVVQSSVGDDDRSEAGGIQNTAQQLGSSLGTAVLGAIVITGLITAFSNKVESDPRISSEVNEQVQDNLSSGGSFIAAAEVEIDRNPGGPRAEDRRSTRRKLRRLPTRRPQDRAPVRRLPRRRRLLHDPPIADPALRGNAVGARPARERGSGLVEVLAVEPERDVVRHPRPTELREAAGVEDEQERGGGGAVEDDREQNALVLAAVGLR